MQASRDYERSTYEGTPSVQGPPNEQSSVDLSVAARLAQVSSELQTLMQDNPPLASMLSKVYDVVDQQRSASAEAQLDGVQLHGGNAITSHVNDPSLGRRLYQSTTSRTSAFREAITRHPVMDALAGRPLEGVTLQQCAVLCESLRRSSPPPAPPPIGDELFGNEFTRLNAQKVALEKEARERMEADAEAHDDAENECHSIAFHRRDPGNPFSEEVDCYLMHSLGTCKAVDFAATMMRRFDPDECESPTPWDNPLCLEMVGARSDTRVLAHENAHDVCKSGVEGSERGLLPWPRSPLEAMAFTGYARARGIYSFWAHHPVAEAVHEEQQLHWVGADNQPFVYGKGETRCVLIDTLVGDRLSSMFARLQPCGMRRADGVVCEQASAHPPLPGPTPLPPPAAIVTAAWCRCASPSCASAAASTATRPATAGTPASCPSAPTRRAAPSSIARAARSSAARSTARTTRRAASSSPCSRRRGRLRRRRHLRGRLTRSPSCRRVRRRTTGSTTPPSSTAASRT